MKDAVSTVSKKKCHAGETGKRGKKSYFIRVFTTPCFFAAKFSSFSYIVSWLLFFPITCWPPFGWPKYGNLMAQEVKDRSAQGSLPLISFSTRKQNDHNQTTSFLTRCFISVPEKRFFLCGRLSLGNMGYDLNPTLNWHRF